MEEYCLTSSRQTHAHREIKLEENSGLPGGLVVISSLPVLKAGEFRTACQTSRMLENSKDKGKQRVKIMGLLRI